MLDVYDKTIALLMTKMSNEINVEICCASIRTFFCVCCVIEKLFHFFNVNFLYFPQFDSHVLMF